MNLQKTFLPYFFGNKKGMSFSSLKVKNQSEIDSLSLQNLSFADQLLIHLLQGRLADYVFQLFDKIEHLENKDIFHLLNYYQYLPLKCQKKMTSDYKEQVSFYNKALTASVLSSQQVNELLKANTGKASAYALLNEDRSLPGIVLIKNANGDFLKEKGQIWHRPILGESSRGLSFQYPNGRTPMGIYLMQSVMPEADQYDEFGLFRRVKLEFIKSMDVSKQMIPKSHHDLFWWKQSHLAFELGRSHLRIHGSGRLNLNPFSPHFPMVSSSGCLTLMEFGAFFFNIFHQRDFLNAQLRGQGLDHSYENELKIHGLLYVVETNGKYQTLEII